MKRFMEEIRSSISEGTFDEVEKKWLAAFSA
jgi:queuine/archaeosine tRNA-ribosyltransferase